LASVSFNLGSSTPRAAFIVSSFAFTAASRVPVSRK
jgi:hypothetical protein